MKYCVSQAKPRIMAPERLAILLIGDIWTRNRRVLAYGISLGLSKATNEEIFS
jgi:hypothetical protein